MSNTFPTSPPRVVEGITLKFPAKLWRIVNGCLSGAVSWTVDGTTIKINKREFEMEYLNSKRHFKTVNFPSFIRQLNIYGFRKQTGSGQWYDKIGVFEYKHRCFQKGRPELLSHVTRNVIARKERDCQKIRQSLAKSSMEANGACRTASTDHRVSEHVTRTIGRRTLFHPLIRVQDVDQHSADGGDWQAAADMPVISSGDWQAAGDMPVISGGDWRAAGDMPVISPRRLHDQVADVLSRVDPVETVHLGQSDSQYGENRESGTDSGVKVVAEGCPITLPPPYGLSNPVVFLPGHPDMDSIYMDKKLSELNVDFLCDSSDNSQNNKEPMFSSATEKETDDLAATLHDVLANDCQFSRNTSSNDWLYPGASRGAEHGSPQLYRAMYSTDEVATCFDPSTMGTYGDTMCGDLVGTYGESMEDAVFTPAYFDPVTGTVTLMLPTSTDGVDFYNV